MQRVAREVSASARPLARAVAMRPPPLQGSRYSYESKKPNNLRTQYKKVPELPNRFKISVNHYYALSIEVSLKYCFLVKIVVGDG